MLHLFLYFFKMLHCKLKVIPGKLYKYILSIQVVCIIKTLCIHYLSHFDRKVFVFFKELNLNINLCCKPLHTDL